MIYGSLLKDYWWSSIVLINLYYKIKKLQYQYTIALSGFYKRFSLYPNNAAGLFMKASNAIKTSVSANILSSKGVRNLNRLTLYEV